MSLRGRRTPGSRAVAAALIAALSLTLPAAAWAQPGQIEPVQINGAGATFPYPLYSAWFAAYRAKHPEVAITYLSIGSGAGIRQISELIVFFGATDTPMNEDEFQAAPGRILHLPTVVGAVVPIYNLPGFTGEVKLSGPVLAGIFLGRITNWNDPAIAALNDGVRLPPLDITVVSRSDSSGTSFIFTDFLSKTSPQWRRLIGSNRAPNLPVGVREKGSEGVSTLVARTPGAIGYVELTYAVRNKLEVGSVQNAEGEFVRPSIASAAAAAAAAVGQMPRDLRVSITNAPGRGVYPIASFTWILLYQNARDKRRSRLMVDFLRWALTDGQAMAADLGYAPLPPPIVELTLAALKTVRVQ